MKATINILTSKSAIEGHYYYHNGEFVSSNNNFIAEMDDITMEEARNIVNNIVGNEALTDFELCECVNVDGIYLINKTIAKLWFPKIKKKKYENAKRNNRPSRGGYV